MTIRNYEIRIEMPDGFELVGVKTDGDAAILICRPHESEVRTIGFATVDGELCDEDEEEWDEDEKKHSIKTWTSDGIQGKSDL